MASRIVWQQTVAAPESLEVRERALPEPGAGEVRVRITAAALNPVDWKVAEIEGLAERFGLSFPAGYGNDLAGVVDAVGEGVSTWSVGDRVFGGKRGGALADHAILAAQALTATPDGVSDQQAASIPIAGRTAAAAIDAIGLEPGDTVLIGGAAGGVGGFAVQLATAKGANVIGTASEANHEWLRGLGVAPVTYGEGLVDRVRAIAHDGVDAAADLHGTAAAAAALELGVAPGRVSTIAAGPDGQEGTVAVGGGDAPPDASAHIAAALADGSMRVEITEMPLDRLVEAIGLVREGHVRGKVVLTIEGESGGEA